MSVPLVRFSSFEGRAQELATLNDARRETTARRRVIVQLVGGDAGIGKTRLMQEFRATLPRRQLLLASSRCQPYGGTPYAPLLQMLNRFDPGAASRIADVKDRGAFFSAVAERYRDIASARSTILFIEDLHWADAGTMELLLYLARSLENVRLLVTGTYRSEELRERHPLVEPFAQLLREPVVRNLQLDPLPDRVLRSLIEGERSRIPDVDSDTIRDVLARADGNPFCAEELLTGVIRNPGSPSEIPLSIRASVQQRVLLLRDAERNVVEHAAILGRSFDLTLLRRVAGCSADLALRALQSARALQLIDQEADDGGEFYFRHALTREYRCGARSGPRAVNGRQSRSPGIPRAGGRNPRQSAAV
jgi:predicted ATPase